MRKDARKPSSSQRPPHRRPDHKPRPAAAQRDGARPHNPTDGRVDRHQERRPDRKPDRKPDRRTEKREPEPAGHPIGTMRIAKAMARAGLCSRREAERWIAEGRVAVNGKLLATPAFEVGPRDRVLVDGQPLPDAEPVRLWRYHKPRGLVTTHKDPEGRPTVFDNLPPGLPRVISIGRLDYNTEGLLLLTTDGALARHLELPATGWLRRYRVRARGRITQAQLDELKSGVSIDGVNYGPIEATLDGVPAPEISPDDMHRREGANIWLTVGLREGKNREIRKIMGHLGLDVGRLIRVSFGPFQLMDLEPGTVEPVRRRVLAEQLGPKLARELGVVAGTERQERPRLRGKAPSPKHDEDE